MNYTDTTDLEKQIEQSKKNEPNFEREQIEKTPFWVIGNKEQGYNLIMGKWKLNTEPFQAKSQLKAWMNTDHWNIILSMIICVTNDLQNTTTTPQQDITANQIQRPIK